MTTIYSDYDQEPEDFYHPLPANIYRELYDIEMGSFAEDLPFYIERINSGLTILELGCGSGRLTKQLCKKGHKVTGVDISHAMLLEAKLNTDPTSNYICMDMRTIAFNTTFDVIIIPYNTLNLLTHKKDIESCLLAANNHLKPGGKLLLQLYIPTSTLRSEPGKKHFQFQLFDNPKGGRIVKEILRTYYPTEKRLEMVEQYKIRPMQAGVPNINYSNTMQLRAETSEIWLERIRSCNFSVKYTQNGYTRSASTPSKKSGILMIECFKTVIR